MIGWKKILIRPSTSILSAMGVLDASKLQIVLVVDDQEKLLGSITDGDIRRALLAGISVDDPVEGIMDRSPKISSIQDSREDILMAMKRSKIHQIPLVDENHRIVGIEVIDDIMMGSERNNWAILMAGGDGKRLRPYTEFLPKPMVEISNTPILEIIIGELKKYGFRNFIISLNYRKEIIKDHFGDGSKLDVNIQYVQENKKLGTAGALGLLQERPDDPFLVMNADLLTKVNYSVLLDYHREQNAEATVCIREYQIKVPFGVVKLEKHKLLSINEKPTHQYFVNAGIYILNPSVLDLIKPNKRLDMNELLERLVKEKKNVSVFPICEYWLNVGRELDLERAKMEFPIHFGPKKN